MERANRSGHVIEVLSEIRFAGSLDVPTGVVLPGLLYGQLVQNGTVTRIEALPQAAIPAKIRSKDANLRHLATHRMVGDNVVVAVGDLVLNVSQLDSYDGWPAMKSLTADVFDKAMRSGTLGAVERASLKYVNLIPGELGADQFGSVNVHVDIGSRALTSEAATIRVELKFGDVAAVIQLASQATLEAAVGTADIPKQGIGLTGIVLEMDLIVSKNFSDLESIMDALEQAHERAKELYLNIVGGG